MPSPSYIPVVRTGVPVEFTRVTVTGDAAADDAITARIAGDTEARFGVDADGTLRWGSGSAAPDVSLRRYAAGGIETDAAALRMTAGQLLFRPDGSVNLYSDAAGQLHTDDSFDATGVVSARGQLLGADFTPADHGFETWTHDPYFGVSSTSAVNGRVYAVKLPVRRARTIDTLWWAVATAGVTPTAGQNWVGLYSSAGVRLAQTGVDASVTSAGGKGTAITAQALDPAVDPFVWQLMLFNAATPPALLRGSSFETTPSVNLGTTALRAAVVASGQTALPASFDPATLTTNACLTLWAALEAA